MSLMIHSSPIAPLSACFVQPPVSLGCACRRTFRSIPWDARAAKRCVLHLARIRKNPHRVRISGRVCTGPATVRGSVVLPIYLAYRAGFSTFGPYRAPGCYDVSGPVPRSFSMEVRQVYGKGQSGCKPTTAKDEFSRMPVHPDGYPAREADHSASGFDHPVSIRACLPASGTRFARIQVTSSSDGRSHEHFPIPCRPFITRTDGSSLLADSTDGTIPAFSRRRVPPDRLCRAAYCVE